MAPRKIPLTGGDYRARWLGANAQRCLSWYPEKNPPDSPFPYTYYQTPGLTIQSAPPQNGSARMLYRTSQGEAYACVGNVVYYVDQSLTWHPIQTLTTGGNIPVSMADNGLVGIIVDGSTNGYAVDLKTRVSLPIDDGGTGTFYGANRVDYLDTFFLLNRPGTAQWYISLSEVTQAMLTGGPIVTGTILSGGTGYTDGTYYLVNLTGGAGDSATAVITIAGGIVTGVQIIATGESFRAGDILSADLTGIIGGGAIGPGGIGYLDGTYASTALTGGSGTGAFGDITVTGGTVTAVANLIGGVSYKVGDQLSASTLTLGPDGSGFIFTVTSVGGSGAGFTYKLSAVGSSAFDPLDIAAKTGYPDPLANGPVAMHREVWLPGALTSEVWYNAGSPDFAFAAFPGVFIEHGVLAPWSLAPQDINLYWLARDKQGRAIVVTGSNYTATRISTHAIENEIQTYPTPEDAVAFIHQVDGHVFYVLNFIAADKTWVYDAAEQLWHERAWIDQNGVEHRHRAQCYAAAYNMNLCLDWENGTLYELDPNVYNDFGGPIKRLRSFPHLSQGMSRQMYSQFTVDIQTGSINPDTILTTTGILSWTNNAGLPLPWTNNAGNALIWNGAPAYETVQPLLSIRWSDDRGETFGNPVVRSIGSAGHYNYYPTVYRCGYGRDRVFEVSLSVDAQVSLNGGYAQVESSSS